MNLPSMQLLALLGIERESLDCRSSGDSRNRVDAYFVAYSRPDGEWICRFEVPRGQKFTPVLYPTSEAALANRGFTL